MSVKKVTYMDVDTSSAKFRQIFPEYAFAQSAASNAEWDARRGDGKAMVYIAAVDQYGSMFIKGLDANDDSSEDLEEIMPVVIPAVKEKKNPMCFGTALTADGIMWLTLFNMDLIMSCDLKDSTVKMHIGNVPNPNAIICTDDPNILYVVGGTNIPDRYTPTAHLTERAMRKPAAGLVYKISLASKQSVTVLDAKSLGPFGGAILLDKKLYLSQLHSIKKVETEKFTEKNSRIVQLTHVWHGSQCGQGEAVYLTENFSIWKDDKIMVALGIHVSLNAAAKIDVQVPSLFTQIQNMFGCMAVDIRPTNADILRNVHNNGMSIRAPSGDTEDAAFFIMDTKTHRQNYYKFSTADFPDDVGFNNSITHIQRHGNKVVIINHECNYVMVLNDEAIINATKEHSLRRISGATQASSRGCSVDSNDTYKQEKSVFRSVDMEDPRDYTPRGEEVRGVEVNEAT